jgi:hypothetical protein
MDDQERLEFAIRFAQMDLSKLRRGDWLNLNDDLLNFIAPPNTPPFKKAGEVLAKENGTDLQKEILHVLNELTRLRDEGEFSFESVDASAEWPLQIGFMITAHQPGSVNILPIGETRDLVLMRLFSLFAQEAIDKILRCEASDCNRIFYKKRKQRYCSPRCQTREFMKTWRKENGEKESARNHKKYKKRVEKVRGRPTKIARRPRRKAQE